MLLGNFIKRNENYIAIGSWCGERVVDNSKYLMDYLDKELPHYNLFWVGKKSIKEEVLSSFKNVVFLEKDKFMSYETWEASKKIVNQILNMKDK